MYNKNTDSYTKNIQENWSTLRKREKETREKKISRTLKIKCRIKVCIFLHNPTFIKQIKK